MQKFVVFVRGSLRQPSDYNMGADGQLQIVGEQGRGTGLAEVFRYNSGVLVERRTYSIEADGRCTPTESETFV